jgi:hypothetical protein
LPAGQIVVKGDSESFKAVLRLALWLTEEARERERGRGRERERESERERERERVRE